MRLAPHPGCLCPGGLVCMEGRRQGTASRCSHCWPAQPLSVLRASGQGPLWLSPSYGRSPGFDGPSGWSLSTSSSSSSDLHLRSSDCHFCLRATVALSCGVAFACTFPQVNGLDMLFNSYCRPFACACAAARAQKCYVGCHTVLSCLPLRFMQTVSAPAGSVEQDIKAATSSADGTRIITDS